MIATRIPFKSEKPRPGAVDMGGYYLLECEQGTPAWLEARAGLTTASEFGDAVSVLTKRSGDKVAGDPTDKAETIAAATALELIIGKPWATVEHMGAAARRGKEEEWRARESYTQKYDLDVFESGIAISADNQFGYSTDGEVERKGSDSLRGGIEVKTPLNALKLQQMLVSGDTGEYEHQMHGGMWLCAWDFIDYIMWIPEKHDVDGDGLYVKRIYRNEDFIEKMVSGLMRHREMVWRSLCIFRTNMDILAAQGIGGVRFDQDTVIDVEARTVAAIKAIEHAPDLTASGPPPAPAPAPAPAVVIDPSIAALFG